MRKFFGGLAGIAALGLACSADAALVVDAGTWSLLPNQAGQQIQFSIAGTGSVTNATVIAQITGATSPKPTFTGGDIITGTIFASNNTGSPSYDFSAPQMAYADIATNTGTVDGNGTLVSFTVDTTGIWSGDFNIALVGTSWGSSVVGTSPTTDVTFNAGFINVVPEPTSLGLVAVVLAFAGCTRVRRRVDVDQA